MTWMAAMRWSIRVLGMLNVIILARLLMPSDFGLIAMSSIIIGLVTTLTDGSVDHAIARAKDPTPADYNSAWTLQICVGLVNGLIIIVVSPLFVWLYGDPRLQTLFMIGAIAPIIIGFENIGTVDFRRSLDFRKEYRYWIIRKFLKIGITICLALVLRNYFALALTAPISSSCIVILSFLMSPYRPCFDVSRIRHLWHFSKWLIVLDSSRMFERRGDEFAGGVYGAAADLGHYSVASDLATMPTREIIEPMDRVLLPALSQHRNNPEKIVPLLAPALSLIVAISFATGFGMYLVADPFVRVFLGPQWLDSIEIFKVIALSAVAGGIALGLRPIFLVLGEEKRLARIYFLSLFVFMPMFLVIAATQSFYELALTRIALSFWLLGASLIYPLKAGYLTLKTVLAAFMRPALASFVMFAAVSAVHIWVWDQLILILIRDVVVGAAAYTATLYLGWRQLGQPSGPEAEIYKKLGQLVATAKQRS